MSIKKSREAAHKKTLAVALSAALLLLALYLLQRLLMPKYMGDVREGAYVSEYYGEKKDHDVIFIGDCELYGNLSPMVLWEEYGINSYIRGTPQQTIWQSYGLMEETFSYEKPKVVVFNVLAMKYDRPQKEAYNRLTLDGMRWSKAKVDSIRASMLEEEHFIEYVFPLLRYHDRWSELTAEDFKYFWRRETVTHNGYDMRVGVVPAGYVPEGDVLEDYNFGENAWRYLDQMRELCRENGVELVLVKAPSLYPHWYQEWEGQIESYAKMYGLKYYNFLESTEEIGIDYQTDTYDGGLHLNLSGSEKLARYFGGILAEDCGVESRRGEEGLERAWAKKRVRYDAEAQAGESP